MSIQTYLEKNGYVPIEKEEAFHSLVDGTVIPFSTLAGHTVESFRALAEKEGWTMTPEEEPGEPKEVTIRVLYTPPHCDQFEESKDGSLSCHTPVPMTKEQFEQQYAAQRGETVQQLHERGRFAAPCNCGAGICLGWQMLFDEKIVEARIVEVQYADSPDGPWIPVAKKENWILRVESSQKMAEQDGQFTPEELEYIERREIEKGLSQARQHKFVEDPRKGRDYSWLDDVDEEHS